MRLLTAEYVALREEKENARREAIRAEKACEELHGKIANLTKELEEAVKTRDQLSARLTKPLTNSSLLGI